MLDEYVEYKQGSTKLKLLNKNMKHLQPFQLLKNDLKKNEEANGIVHIAVSHQG